MGKTRIKIGTIKGQDIITTRQNKPNRNDNAVKAGCGIQEPKKHREKGKQRDKNQLRDLYK